MQREARDWLLAYCRKGEQLAFSRFYRRHSPRLWRFLVARGATVDGAYDLLSEVFTRFVRVVCKDLSSPLGLLYRIAVNAQIDSHRRRVASPLVLDPDAVARAADVRAEVADEREHVRRLVGTLPDDEQNLLLMRYWIGLTHKEIAAVLDMPEGTVRRRTAALLRELRDRWESIQ